jgi:hypothetical protein
MLRNVKIQIFNRRILLLVDADARYTLLKQLLIYLSTLPLLLLLRKLIKLLLSPYNRLSKILHASTAIIYLLYYVTRKSLKITYVDSSLKLLDISNSTATRRKAPLQNQTLQLQTLKPLCR